MIKRIEKNYDKLLFGLHLLIVKTKLNIRYSTGHDKEHRR